MAYITGELAPNAELLPRHISDKHYERKHGAGAYYGQSGK